MKKIISNILKKPFVRNVVVLASGTAFAQIINLLFAPILTRIYGPSAYGLMGTFSAIIQIISPIAAFSYPIAIVLSKDEKDANLTIKLSFYVTLFNTILFSLLLYFFHDHIVKTFNLISVSNYFYLIPLIVFFAGCLQILQQWLVRNNLFRISAKAYLVETVLVNSGKLIGGIIYPSASILILFTAFRQGIRVILMFIYSKINNVKEVLSLTTISDMKEVLKQGIKHKDFLIYRTPEVTLSALSANIPTLLLTAFFGPVSAGFYSIAKTVLAVPSTLIAQSVGDVFYPQVVRTAQNKQKITPLIIKSTFYLAVIGLIPYGFIFFFGPWLFGVVFGEEWIIAGEYARWVAIWSFFNFINRPSVQSLPVLSAQRFQLIFTVFRLIITSLALIIGFFVFKSDLVAIGIFGVTGGISYIILIVITLIKSRAFDELNTPLASA